jgi:phage host-nuclease inhibitor protein Gam
MVEQLDETTGRGRTALLEKLRRLQKQLQQVEADKKSTSEDYGAQIKEIKAEIKGTLTELDDMPAIGAQDEISG